MHKNSSGYISFILLGIALTAVLLAGSFVTFPVYNPDNATYTLATPTPYGNYKTLELHTLAFVSVIPTAVPTEQVPGQQEPSLCQDNSINTEANILVGYSPAQGQTVGTTGQVKVWVTDENPPCVGTGETVDSATGLVTTRGNTTEKASDGYLWEPALYVDNFAENGGSPYFPDYIKGTFNNAAKTNGGSSCVKGGSASSGPAIDPAPGPTLGFADEYIWNVSSLKLAPGTHQAEFVIHDGDIDRGIGCASITIQ